MKKFILICLLFIIQTFPIYGNVNDQGLLCECTHRKLSIGSSLLRKFECQFLFPIFFSNNKVYSKGFYIHKDKVLIKENEINPEWYSNENTISWYFKKDEYKLTVIPSSPSFSLSRKNLVLKQRDIFGSNYILIYFKCNVMNKTEFFDRLNQLKKNINYNTMRK